MSFQSRSGDRDHPNRVRFSLGDVRIVAVRESPQVLRDAGEREVRIVLTIDYPHDGADTAHSSAFHVLMARIPLVDGTTNALRATAAALQDPKWNYRKAGDSILVGSAPLLSLGDVIYRGRVVGRLSSVSGATLAYPTAAARELVTEPRRLHDAWPFARPTWRHTFPDEQLGTILVPDFVVFQAWYGAQTALANELFNHPWMPWDGSALTAGTRHQDATDTIWPLTLNRWIPDAGLSRIALCAYDRVARRAAAQLFHAKLSGILSNSLPEDRVALRADWPVAVHESGHTFRADLIRLHNGGDEGAVWLATRITGAVWPYQHVTIAVEMPSTGAPSDTGAGPEGRDREQVSLSSRQFDDVCSLADASARWYSQQVQGADFAWLDNTAPQIRVPRRDAGVGRTPRIRGRVGGLGSTGNKAPGTDRPAPVDAVRGPTIFDQMYGALLALQSLGVIAALRILPPADEQPLLDGFPVWRVPETGAKSRERIALVFHFQYGTLLWGLLAERIPVSGHYASMCRVAPADADPNSPSVRTMATDLTGSLSVRTIIGAADFQHRYIGDEPKFLDVDSLARRIGAVLGSADRRVSAK
jgi:hypothetical protein